MQLDTNPASDPEVKALIAQTDQLVAEAEAYRVTTAVEYENSAEILKRIKGHQKELERMELKITRPINAGLKALRDLFRGPRDRAARAESCVKRALIAYSNEQERLRREEQRKAEEAARKEREKLEAQAAKAAAAGRIERAEQLEERAATVVAPVIQREAPRVSGVSMREVWKFEIVDPSKINAAFMMPDEKKIGAQVRALKGDAAAIIGPGVRVYMEKQLAAGVA